MILPNRIVVFTKKYTLFFLIGLSPIVIGDELDYKEKLKCVRVFNKKYKHSPKKNRDFLNHSNCVKSKTHLLATPTFDMNAAKKPKVIQCFGVRVPIRMLEIANGLTFHKGNYTFGNGNSIYACDIGVGNCTDYHSYFILFLIHFIMFHLTSHSSFLL